MKNRLFLFFLGVLLFASVGCNKFIEESNLADPNQPLDVPIENMLPSIMINLVDSYSGDFSMYGNSFIQHIEATSRCTWLAVYNIEPERSNAVWENYYTKVLNEIRIAKTKATANEWDHHQAVLLSLEAYALMMLTDYFDDIPYSQSIVNGGSNFHPTFDSQTDIYKVIFANLETASELITTTPENLSLAKGDVFYQGNVQKWEKAIQGMMARAALHLGDYQSALDHAQKSFTTADENLGYQYTGGEKAAPWFRFNRDRAGDFIPSSSLQGLLETKNDLARSSILIQPMTTDHTYFNENQFVELLTYREMQFIIAECELRLSGTSIAVQQAYEEGIKASFRHLNINETEIANYLNQEIVNPGWQNLNLQDILLQKYFSLFAQPEAYNDYRRTDYPGIIPSSGPSIPVRLPYPESELELNNNAPNQANIIFDKVGWDN